MPEPEAADQAHDLAGLDGQRDAGQHSWSPYVLRRPLDPRQDEAPSLSTGTRPARARRSRAASQSAKRASGTVMATKKHAATTYGV